MKFFLAALGLAALVLVSPGSAPQPSTPVQPRAVAAAVSTSGGATTGAVASPGSEHPALRVESVSQLVMHAKLNPPQGAPFRGGVRPHAATEGASPLTTPKTPSTSTPRAAVFGGLNRPGMSADLSTPPDSTGAIGSNHYVEMDNSNIAVYDRNLNLVTSASLDTFSGSGGGPAWCDPQIQWDQAAGRWLTVFLLCNGAPGASAQGFLIGFSKNGNPSDLGNGWCIYGVPTGNSLFDYPKLGHNSNWMIVGGNSYDVSVSFVNPPLQGAGLAWVGLPPNGASLTTCPKGNTIAFDAIGPAFGSAGLKNGDNSTLTFTPVPLNTISGATDGYVVSAYDPAGNVGSPAPQSKLAVWHINQSGTLFQDPDITVITYDAPPAAAQKGSSNVIDTLDGRLTQAVGDPTTGIWTQHTVKNGSISKVTWYELKLAAGTLAELQEGDITNGSEFVFNAAVSPTYGGNGAAVIEYNRSSSSIDPVVAVRTRWSTTPAGTFAADDSVLATSAAAVKETLSCNNPPSSPCRWGDYSAATPDPVNTSVVWGTNEFNTAGTALPAWQDENFAVEAWVPPGTPTNIVATAADGHVCVGWIPSVIDAGTPDTSYKVQVYQGVTLIASVTVAAPTRATCVYGLTNDVAYTVTVTAINLAGPGIESAPVAVTPTRATSQAPPPSTPPRGGTSQGPPPPSPTPR